jgi:Protein of unknown function (DUF2796)
MRAVAKHLTTAAAACFIAIASASATAAQDTRQLGAHQHGAGKLEIAIEGDTVHIGLDVPGADIVGFERAAKTPAELAAILDAKRLLADPLKLFVPPPAAGCTVKSAEVKLEGEDEPGDTKTADTKTGDTKTGGDHADFTADYTLTCTDVTKLTSFDVQFFATFKSAQTLSVSIISAAGQTELDVTRNKPKLIMPATK